MSATVASSADHDEAVYGRLFREGRGEVLKRMRSEFPSASREDLEDAASLALLEMVRRRQLTEWRSGAIGQWEKLTRYRLVDQARRARLHEQKARLQPSRETLGERATPQTPLEQIEAALSAWRVVELMAQMPPRAATYVQLQLIERKRRAEVLAATGWSTKQYERAQAAAKHALHATLGDLEGTAECTEHRHLIDARELGEDLAERARLALHAHVERCGSCRLYASEARRTLHGVAPLLTLAWSGAAGGGTFAALGGSAVPAGLVAKGIAVLSASAICLGGVYALSHHEHHRGARTTAVTVSQPSAGSPVRRPARSAPASPLPRTRSDASGGDALGLDSSPTVLRERPRPAAAKPDLGLGPAVRPPSPPAASDGSAEAAFGLGAPLPPSPPKQALTCSPGELGC